MKKFNLIWSLLAVTLMSGCLSNNLDQINTPIDEENVFSLIDTETNIEFPNWKNNRDNYSIIFTGDVMLGRYVETLMNKNGLNYPFELVGDRLNLADDVIINLEGPVQRSDKHIQTPDYTTNFSFDEKVLSVFEQNNIGIVNLSNNHTYDKGTAVFAEMTNILSENGIDWFGHPTEYDNKYLHTINANGVNINLLGFHEATISNFNIESMEESIASTVEIDSGALNIVNFHFGPEYRPISSDIQKNIARAAVDAGADMIIGHHPHVTQEMEIYKGVPIFYSLGNFIFDQYFSEETERGLAVEMTIEFKNITEGFNFKNDPYALLGGKHEIDRIGLRLLPLKSNLSQPQFLGKSEYDVWIKEYAAKSKIGNTESEYFYEWTY